MLLELRNAEHIFLGHESFYNNLIMTYYSNLTKQLSNLFANLHLSPHHHTK